MKKILAVFLLTIFIVSALPCVSVGFAVNGQTSASVVKAEQWWTRKPDLTLTSDDIVFSPASPTEGETVTITATIRNIGEGWARSVKVGFYEESPEGDLIGTDTIRWLRAGGSGDASVEWIAELGYDICVVADPDDAIDESNEDNNVAYAPNPVAPAEPIHDVAVISVTPNTTKVVTGGVVRIDVVVENQGTETETFDVTSYYDSVVIGTPTVTSLTAGATETLEFFWDTTGYLGTYTIKANATVVVGEEDITDNEFIDGAVEVVEEYTLTFIVTDSETGKPILEAKVVVDGQESLTDDEGMVSFVLPEETYSYTVSKVGYEEQSGSIDLKANTELPIALVPAPPYDYQLFVEIDYIGDHKPTQMVLDYIESYYMGNNPTGDMISVTFITTNVTTTVIGLGTVNYDNGINDDEFWAIEAACNDLGYDSKTAYDDPVFGTDGVYSSKWKWVLFGTVYEDAPDVVMGYCYVIVQQVSRWRADMLGGNYIFVADEATDNWAGGNLELKIGAEACVLMHEMGHSIGIGELRYSWWYGWVEDYCSDPTCVMSTLSTSNAGLYKDWHYCTAHWAQKDMDYYA